MAFTDASRAAAGSTANGPRELAHTGKRRGSLATTICPESQALARITARAERLLRELEWRIGRIGELVGAGQVDRSLVVERLGVVLELARLEGASMPEAEAAGVTEEEIERAVHEGEQSPIESRHQRYYRENREKVREAQRLHYIANREARRERARKYYAENSERERKRLSKFYFAHRAHVLEKKRAAYSARAAAAKAEREQGGHRG
jgi:hypothetical protein